MAVEDWVFGGVIACDICWGGCGFARCGLFDLFPTAYQFLLASLGFRTQSIYLLGV